MESLVSDFVQPPRGYVLVDFIEPYTGCTLVSEHSLILIDRALCFGDVVKRRPTDSYSGTVIGLSNTCRLRPIFSEPPQQNWNPWKHSGSDLLVPESEIKLCPDYQDGDHVIYKGWVGIIKEIHEAVTIRLNNGSVVEVIDPEDLELTAGSVKVGIWGPRKALNLFTFLQKQLDTSFESHKTRPIETGNYVGQTVVTKRGNLRRGIWKSGAYDPAITPQGVVVEVRPLHFNINWLLPNYFLLREQPEPPPWLDSEELEGSGVRYDRSRLPQGLLSSTFSDVATGDHVRFRNPAGAVSKYDEEISWVNQSKSSGTFLPVPKSTTQGYDMNVFQVRETHTKVDVQWQDGSQTREDSIKLSPYLHIDDHEVWPGELVAAKENIENAEGGRIRPKRVGVVQSTDAEERLACVRWFSDPKIEIVGADKETLLHGSALGTMSDDISTISLYEIEAFPALSSRRGDIALVNYKPLEATGEKAPSESFLSRVAHIWDSSRDTSGITWVGEIVDLRLDGQVTVRLGALKMVQDFTVPVHEVIIVSGLYDHSSSSDSDATDPSADEWEYGDSGGPLEALVEPLDEIIEYEGGERLDSEHGDEMWATEDEATGSGSSMSLNSGKNSSTNAGEHVLDDTTITSAVRQHTNVSTEPQIKFGIERIKTPSPVPGEGSHGLQKKDMLALTPVNWPGMPSQFDILEGVPVDHRFWHVEGGLGARALRRIRKDHGVLASSLPDGTFARTWESRLDLVRVVIVGPRGTPYELAPFVFDFQFTTNYPDTPPSAHFHSWTSRVNPNLYEDGNICLSLLGTWKSEGKNEAWSPDGSSMLQVVVSIMGLVLVKEPYYSESINFHHFQVKYDDLSAFGSSMDC